MELGWEGISEIPLPDITAPPPSVPGLWVCPPLCPSFFLFEDDYCEPHLDRARNSHFLPCSSEAHLTPSYLRPAQGRGSKEGGDLRVWEMVWTHRRTLRRWRMGDCGLEGEGASGAGPARRAAGLGRGVMFPYSQRAKR